MSTITSDQTAFETAYGTAAQTLSFALLVDGSRRVDALSKQQLLHASTAAPLIKSTFGKVSIDVYAYAFDLGDWQIGSTNSTLRSRLPALRWGSDLAVQKLPGFSYLWVIAPSDSPFILNTAVGFRGVIPDTDETVFFFSEDFGITTLGYECTGAGGDFWQNDPMTWQGDAVTW